MGAEDGPERGLRASAALSRRSSDDHDGGAPAAALGGRVLEGRHQRMAFEQRPHRLALYANPAPMDDSNLSEPAGRRLPEIFIHHRSYVARSEGVEIERIFDRDLDGRRILGRRHRGRRSRRAWRHTVTAGGSMGGRRRCQSVAR